MFLGACHLQCNVRSRYNYPAHGLFTYTLHVEPEVVVVIHCSWCRGKGLQNAVWDFIDECIESFGSFSHGEDGWVGVGVMK